MTMIENFGSYLKRERELRGVPLEKISATTKIHIRFLQALENNQFDELPGKVFVKGYIRSFAKIIGSDEDEMLNAYDDTMEKLSSTNGENKNFQVADKLSIVKKSLIGSALTIIFIVGVGWGANILIHKFSGSSKESSSAVSKPDFKEIEKLPEKKLSAPVIEMEEKPASLEETDKVSGNPITTGKPENPADQPSSAQSDEPIQPAEKPPETEKKEIEKLPEEELSAPVIEREEKPASLEETDKVSGNPITTGKPENPLDQPSAAQSDEPIQPAEKPLETEKNEDKVLESKAKPDTMVGISDIEKEDKVFTPVAGNDLSLKLTIKVKNNVWFNMTVDESRVEDFILQRGTAKTFYGKDKFRMTIGNRDLVELSLNDQILSLPQGDGNNVVREFIINSQLIE